MPNWCAVDVKFFGNKDNIERLYHDWETALKTIREGDSNWLGRLLIYNNIDPDIIYCRGFVRDICLADDILSVHSEDAWAPMSDFYEFAAALYNVQYVYSAEEPGSGVYVNTDTEGRFFTDRYKIELYVEDMDQYKDDPLIQTLNELSSDAYFDNFDDIARYLGSYGVNSEEDIESFVKLLEDRYPDVILEFVAFDKR
jgi:hypothetical protein